MVGSAKLSTNPLFVTQKPASTELITLSGETLFHHAPTKSPLNKTDLKPENKQLEKLVSDSITPQLINNYINAITDDNLLKGNKNFDQANADYCAKAGIPSDSLLSFWELRNLAKALNGYQKNPVNTNGSVDVSAFIKILALDDRYLSCPTEMSKRDIVTTAYKKLDSIRKIAEK